jgi:HEPN domain-containing protein
MCEEGEELDKDELMNYWIETAEQDYNTMLHLYASKDYHWSLFMGHLVIEKLIKGVYVKNKNSNIPRIHDLLRLAEKAEIELTEEQQDDLDMITAFNISARYPDYKKSFYAKCNYEYTTFNINKVKELRVWLLERIKNQ